MDTSFRQAYRTMRYVLRRDCEKHNLSDDPDEYVDKMINKMSLSEFMNELESVAQYEDGVGYKTNE